MTEEERSGEKMHDENLGNLRKTLRSALPPMTGLELRRDLWPAMSRRMEHPPARIPWFARVPWPTQIPWFDWALLGVAAAILLFFPASIPALLYHF